MGNVSLVGNTKLARESQSLSASWAEGFRFVHENWRLLATPSLILRQKLNWSGLSFLLSPDLLHLAPRAPEEAVCSLQELYSSGIDDEATTYLSCCPLLEILGVAGTKLSASAMYGVDLCSSCNRRMDCFFFIMSQMLQLPTLDLTRCRRGVSVGTEDVSSR